MQLDFSLGFATAATQIEGGDAPTIWHSWADAGGAVDGSTPRVAGDHWNRVEEDVEILRSLGVKHHRMGLEWARIQPEPGRFDPAAIEHYRHELGLLRDAGITPLVTLHHFNDPIWFDELGGFRGASPRFGDYVRHVVTELGDLADEWVTLNEPNVFAYLGHLTGEWPPAEKSVGAYFDVLGAMARAHVRVYHLIHDLQPHAKVGVAHHVRDFLPLRDGHPIDTAIAGAAGYLFQDALIRATTTGEFLPPLQPPKGYPAQPCADFLGINYYSSARMSPRGLTVRDGAETNDLGWELHPEGLKNLIERYAPLCDGPVYITENGTADADDSFRCSYLYDHWEALTRTDARIERYYHWTLIDNWEWAEGEDPRFGVIALNYQTQERTRRPSADFYTDVIANGGVTPEAKAKWVDLDG